MFRGPSPSRGTLFCSREWVEKVRSTESPPPGRLRADHLDTSTQLGVPDGHVFCTASWTDVYFYAWFNPCVGIGLVSVRRQGPQAVDLGRVRDPSHPP